MLNTGTVLCGKYEIVKAIGKGGMSAVYLAKDQSSGMQCAVKVVERSGCEKDSSVIVQSLAAEAGLLKRLSSPQLPKIYDIMESSDSFIMVMEYIEGVSLDRVLIENGPQEVENVIGWGMQICDVFSYLHEQTPPIIYRDMKPANIMLKADGSIKIIDFGTARTQKYAVMQQDTTLFGTVGFAAPEQYGGMGQSDPRSDIYCLGATMYNLITGKMPNQGIRMSIANTDGLKDSTIGQVLVKCLQDDPNMRYQTARELRQDLEQLHHAAVGRRNTGWLKRSTSGPSPTVTGGDTSGWQAVTGLSGLIKAGSAAASTQKRNSGWIQSAPQIAKSAALESGEKHTESVTNAGSQTNEEANTMWSKLQILAIFAVVVFAVLAVISALLDKTGAALGSIGLAAVSAVGCIFCVYRNRENSAGK